MLAHITTQQAWQTAQANKIYRSASLDEVGFIHCSLPEQLLGVANRYYAGERDLLILWIDPQKAQAEIRWEASDDQIFPHLYGALNLEAVIAVQTLLPDTDGVFRNLPAGYSGYNSDGG